LVAQAKQPPLDLLLARVKRYGATLADIAREHEGYKTQIFQLAAVDLLKTYRGSALGWLWAVIKPSVTISVYWFAFSIGLRAGKDMQEMLTQGSTTFKRYNYLVTKIRFPLSTISTFVSISKLYVHLALVMIVTVIFIMFGRPVDVYYLQLPVYTALMFLFFTMWSLFASLLSAMSKDFSNVITSFVMAIFWISGIMWDVNRVNNPILAKVLLFNPVTFIANGYRNVFIYKRWFFQDPFALFAFAVVLVLMFGLSLYTFNRLRRDIADVL
jgi:teichoic acid transport system permease protein